MGGIEWERFLASLEMTPGVRCRWGEKISRCARNDSGLLEMTGCKGVTCEGCDEWRGCCGGKISRCARNDNISLGTR